MKNIAQPKTVPLVTSTTSASLSSQVPAQAYEPYVPPPAPSTSGPVRARLASDRAVTIAKPAPSGASRSSTLALLVTGGLAVFAGVLAITFARRQNAIGSASAATAAPTVVTTAAPPPAAPTETAVGFVVGTRPPAETVTVAPAPEPQAAPAPPATFAAPVPEAAPTHTPAPRAAVARSAPAPVAKAEPKPVAKAEPVAKPEPAAKPEPVAKAEPKPAPAPVAKAEPKPAPAAAPANASNVDALLKQQLNSAIP